MSLLNTHFNNQAGSNANKTSPTENDKPTSPQTESEKKADQRAEAEEEIDIDLTDPEVEKAATKIQAGFKGMKARQQVKEKRQQVRIVYQYQLYPLARKNNSTSCCLIHMDWFTNKGLMTNTIISNRNP